jgi:hypothetical protein
MKNAYNIGARNVDTWDLPSIIRIFTACLDYIACFPSDIPQSDTAELGLMAMRCHFVIAAAHVSMARTTDEVEEQAQRYLETRNHAATFHHLLGTESAPQDERVIQDLHTKLATMTVFDFEGAVALQKWDDLGQIVRRAELCRDETILKAMGDCLLRSQAPGKGEIVLLSLITGGVANDFC